MQNQLPDFSFSQNLIPLSDVLDDAEFLPLAMLDSESSFASLELSSQALPPPPPLGGNSFLLQDLLAIQSPRSSPEYFRHKEVSPEKSVVANSTGQIDATISPEASYPHKELMKYCEQREDVLLQYPGLVDKMVNLEYKILACYPETKKVLEAVVKQASQIYEGSITVLIAERERVIQASPVKPFIENARNTLLRNEFPGAIEAINAARPAIK